MALKKTKTSEFNVAIPTADGAAVAYHVPITITLAWDEAIHDWFVTPESEGLIESTKARHLGLLLPEDIRLLRQRLRLTQRELGELLQIGEKSWTRWETGRQRPSRSINIILRALADGRLDAEYLRQVGSQMQPDWHRVVAYDFRRKQLSMDCQATDRPAEGGTPQTEQLAKAG